jgi:hypothetical protein
MKLKRFTLLMLLGATCTASAQQTKGKMVKVAQADMRPHTVHLLVCTRPGPQDSEPQLRIMLACRQDDAPNCVQPFAGSQGYMEDLDPDSIYEGHNVRVEWLDGKDGTRNVVGAYQVQSSSAEKCEVN